MSSSCTYILSKKGQTLKQFDAFKKLLGGYNKAVEPFLLSISSKFISRYKDNLTFDDQGSPTVESALNTPWMKWFISSKKAIDALNKHYNFQEVENSDENYNMLVNDAKTFNDTNKGFTAYVEQTEDGKIKCVIHNKSKQALKIFHNQYSSQMLNSKLAGIFKDLGLTVGQLTQAEIKNGIMGVTDFNRVKSIANQFMNLIRVAKGMHGQLALSEEFSHLIVGLLRNKPIISRLINQLAENEQSLQDILGESYSLYKKAYVDSEGNTDYNRLAEECLGQLLQNNLLNNYETEKPVKGFIGKLVDRAKSFIYNIFKKYNENDVSKAVVDADSTMSELAKQLLSGQVSFSKEDVSNSARNAVFYNIKEGIDFLDEVINKAIITENKKIRISKIQSIKDKAAEQLATLEKIQSATPDGKLKGLINYAKVASKDYADANEALQKHTADDQMFGMLRAVRSTIQSYAPLIDQLDELLRTKNNELRQLVDSSSVEDKNKTTETLQSVFKNLAAVDRQIKGTFKDLALESCEKFLAPFFSVTSFIDKTGKERTLKDLIEEANGDIGFVDKYLETMSTSSDVLLQLFDSVNKKARGNARTSTITDINEVKRLMLEAADQGIDDFEFAFEKDNEGHKTGNYISQINYGQFNKDKKEFYDKLDDEYGKYPKGSKAIEKINRRKAWISEHCSDLFGNKPNVKMYQNSAYTGMDSAKKDFLKKFLELKHKFDKRLPEDKIVANRAIQKRRDLGQRLFDMAANPSSIIKSVSEAIGTDLLKKPDDDQQFGQRTGLTDFSGNEFMVLPVLYNNPLNNPDELSTDLFSTLSSWAYTTNLYSELDKVVDPLEVCKAVVEEYRKTAKVSNNQNMVEKVPGLSNVYNKIFMSGGTNIEQKLKDFMESQIYQRYYADSDKVIKIFNKEIKANKVTDALLRLTSTASLGFNFLTQLANAATGISMQNIEAIANQFFGAKDLAKADAAYIACLKDFIPELESRVKTNKLALFNELFNVKQDFARRTGNSKMGNILKRMFNESIAFLGMECGDHWLYNRTIIAMTMKQKVKLKDGSVTSLWNALQVVNAFSDNNQIKKLSVPEGATALDTGELITSEWINKFSDKAAHVNHTLFGVYNKDDMVAAQRVAAGRAILQMRQWIVPMFQARFQKRQFNNTMGQYEEGWYRTFGQFFINCAVGLKNGKASIPQVWNELDDGQKANVKRVIVEFSQYMAMYLLINLCSFGKKDPKRSWTMKLAEYMANREMHELGNLTPSLTMGQEILKTVQSPATVLSSLQATLNLTGSILDVRDWNDDIQTGPYKGMSTLEKNIMKAPLPVISQIKQVDRFTDNIENATMYYARSYK